MNTMEKKEEMTMQENIELVQKGFRTLVAVMAAFIGQAMMKVYHASWWNMVLNSVNNPENLPGSGEYADLVDSLDVMNCLRVISRQWISVFQDILPMNCLSYSKELMGVRHTVSHLGTQDLEQPEAERALDTMFRLCKEMDAESADNIYALYLEERAMANGSAPASYDGLMQPASVSSRGDRRDGSLLGLVGTDLVQKTTMSRKVTYAGKTEVYPVYRVRLDALYYNDQNDRITTWISRYESENGTGSLNGLSRDTFNHIIEDFIVESNPEAIEGTQKNIAIFGQREAGVTLSDGRIVDGNRRFTCLRRLAREMECPMFFETVIMDADIEADRKQIKCLELSIQHGEEKKLDYDLIEECVAVYRYVDCSHLMTAEEYAASSFEPLAEVKKRLEIAEIISEFLTHIRLPEQYYAAREYQVYSLFNEMMPLLRKLDAEDQQQLKAIAFNNAMMRAVPDQRKFIRDLKTLIKNGTYAEYFEEQEAIAGVIAERFSASPVRCKEDVDTFALFNSDLAANMQKSLERAILRSRASALKSQPSDQVAHAIVLINAVDDRIIARMDEEERGNLKALLDQMMAAAVSLKGKLESD